MKTKLILLLFFVGFAIYSQSPNKFFKTIQDYSADNFIPGYDIIPNSHWENSWTGEKMYATVNGKKQKMKPAEFP